MANWWLLRFGVFRFRRHRIGDPDRVIKKLPHLRVLPRPESRLRLGYELEDLAFIARHQRRKLGIHQALVPIQKELNGGFGGVEGFLGEGVFENILLP